MSIKPSVPAGNRLKYWMRLAQSILEYPHAPGLFTLVVTLFILSAAVGMQPEHRAKLFIAGEIATIDVIAPRNMQVEDVKATAIRREQLASKQPTIYDLSAAEALRLRQRFLDIFQLLNDDFPELHHGAPTSAAPPDASAQDQPAQDQPVTERNVAPVRAAEPGLFFTDDDEGPMLFVAEDEHHLLAPAMAPLPEGTPPSEEDRDLIVKRLNELSGVTFSAETVRLLSNPLLQAYLVDKALPWIETRLLDGVVIDMRDLRSTTTGILIRDVETGQETLRPDVSGIRDLSTLLARFSQFLRSGSPLSLPERRAVSQITAALISPTLTVNREASRSLGLMASENAQPVYYRINKGEVIVQRGERVTQEQQLKIHAMFRSGKTFLRAPETVGSMVLALLLTVGLFVSPSGKPSSPLRRRDLYFISLLLLLFGLAAKGLYVFGPRILEDATAAALPFAFPAAGVAGLAALIFASRRYCVTGLLLSMFSAMLLGGGLPLFMFFFLAAMCNTWLVMRAQNRQDVVRSMLPLSLCLVPLGFAVALMEGFPMEHAPTLLLCLVINVVLTQFLMFSISPLLELIFGYTTRFRLMELSNLEQPLLQELMVSAPGTYHHCLVTSNMVEAGAKAIGANSLLCKVGALYHDIGKLTYPEYFIENQFGGPNRHDKLAPTMSALILVSHVKKGVELAAKHRLGEDIEDMIRQHHGSSTMKYFYQRALEQAQPGEVIRAEDFQYPGPRPQSREAAIVMVADMVEASSRTLSDPTPARIRTHIDTIIRGIFADGQLDESALTFQDLNKLSVGFARILTGLFHQRIAYPELHRLKKDEKKDTRPAEAAALEDKEPHAV